MNHIESVKLHSDQCSEGDGDGGTTGGSDQNRQASGREDWKGVSQTGRGWLGEEVE